MGVLKAGKEVDGLVAKHVLGWKELTRGTWAHNIKDHGDHSTFEEVAQPPAFSVDETEASKLAAIAGITYRPYEGGWVASHRHDMSAYDGVLPQALEMNGNLVCARTRPMAICIAALKKAGVKVERPEGLYARW